MTPYKIKSDVHFLSEVSRCPQDTRDAGETKVLKMITFSLKYVNLNIKRYIVFGPQVQGLF